LENENVFADDRMELFASVLLVSSAVFWIAVFRYYRNISVELNQYTEPQIKSPSKRAAIVSVSGFASTAVFVIACISHSTFLSNQLADNQFSPLSLIIMFLSVLSPIFNYLSTYFCLIADAGTLFLPVVIGAIIGYAVIVLAPFGYILYKTRKEIEIRFQMAVNLPPKRLHSSYRLHKLGHGNPTLYGILGAIHGIILFPLYLYCDLLKARQGTIEYRSLESKITFDIDHALTATDQALMSDFKVPLCPKCKKPLEFLEDQEKWWCRKCKRAAYVR
jgi:hypothetical protein